MKIEIENIKTVYWKLEALANNLFINEEDKALEICAEHTDSYKFTNTHHKAKQEVEYLALNKNYDDLYFYYEDYKHLLDDIKETCSKYDNKFLRTQVNIHLIPTLEVFDEMKRRLKIDEINIQSKTLDNSQPNKIEEKQKEVFTFKNNFDGIPPEDVYNHFKAGLVDKKHIDLETLKKFLKQAFEDYKFEDYKFEDYKEDEPLKDKLKMNNTTNSLNFIIRVFHKYYSKQVSKHGKKSKYVKLLTDNFIDFDYQKTHDNFRS